MHLHLYQMIILTFQAFPCQPPATKGLLLTGACKQQGRYTQEAVLSELATTSRYFIPSPAEMLFSPVLAGSFRTTVSKWTYQHIRGFHLEWFRSPLCIHFVLDIYDIYTLSLTHKTKHVYYIYIYTYAQKHCTNVPFCNYILFNVSD